MAKRSGNGGGALDPALSQKKRARRRLIGAAALALAAAIVLPMLLDSEPRQQFAEVEVEIPSRDVRLRPPSPDEGIDAGMAPLAQGPDAQTPTALAPFAEEPAVSPSVRPSPALPLPAKQGTDNPARGPHEPLGNSREVSGFAAVDPGPAVSAAPGERPAPRAKTPVGEPQKRAQAAVASPPASAPQPAAEAPKPATASAERPVALQIGAFARPGSAQAMMDRARKAGVRAYTESVQTPDGERTRVRVGPFATREAAERAQGKLELVGIESSIMSMQP